jgi:hypothetical protein
MQVPQGPDIQEQVSRAINHGLSQYADELPPLRLLICNEAVGVFSTRANDPIPASEHYAHLREAWPTYRQMIRSVGKHALAQAHMLTKRVRNMPNGYLAYATARELASQEAFSTAMGQNDAFKRAGRRHIRAQGHIISDIRGLIRAQAPGLQPIDHLQSDANAVLRMDKFNVYQQAAGDAFDRYYLQETNRDSVLLSAAAEAALESTLRIMQSDQYEALGVACLKFNEVFPGFWRESEITHG